MEILFLLLLLLFFSTYWGKGFIQLMLLPDDCFPGKNDKLVWGLAFVFLFPVTPTVFYYWQQAYLVVKESEAGTG